MKIGIIGSGQIGGTLTRRLRALGHEVLVANSHGPASLKHLAADIEAGMTESRWVERQLGHPVTKAFNNIQARSLMERGQPAGTPGRIALPVAGDDRAAKAIVLKLVEALGFDAIDAGGLDDSWRQQPGTPVYVKNFDADGVRRALSEASKERRPEFQGTASSPGSFTGPA